MALQFLRNARLRVGANGALEKEFVGFRVTFKLEKNLDSNPNFGSISIYNLSIDSRSKFEAKNAICSLDVGYGDNLEQIFTGNISKAFTKKQGVDTITEIEIGDGEKAFQEAHIDLSLPAGIDAETIIRKITDTMKNITSGGIKSVKSFLLSQAKSFGTGIVLSGSSKDLLTDITKTCGLEWSIQDGEIQILEANQPTQETQFLLTTSTGLIGSPGRVKSDAGKGIPDGGVEFSCLLQPKLKPGRQVQIKSLSLDGEYRITKLTHEGDNFEGNWLTHCEAFIKK